MYIFDTFTSTLPLHLSQPKMKSLFIGTHPTSQSNKFIFTAFSPGKFSIFLAESVDSIFSRTKSTTPYASFHRSSCNSTPGWDYAASPNPLASWPRAWQLHWPIQPRAHPLRQLQALLGPSHSAHTNATTQAAPPCPLPSLTRQQHCQAPHYTHLYLQCRTTQHMPDSLTVWHE